MINVFTKSHHNRQQQQQQHQTGWKYTLPTFGWNDVYWLALLSFEIRGKKDKIFGGKWKILSGAKQMGNKCVAVSWILSSVFLPTHRQTTISCNWPTNPQLTISKYILCPVNLRTRMWPYTNIHLLSKTNTRLYDHMIRPESFAASSILWLIVGCMANAIKP